jgi:ribosomal-protein-serine acetyltransferase
MFHITIDSSTYLAALAPAHAETLFTLISANRAHLRTWVPWVEDTRTTADAQRFITRAQHQADIGQALYAGLWHQGELTGVLALNYIDMARSQTEFGYWLGAPYQSKGLMTAACRALVDYVFDELGLRRIEIRCSPENHRSRAIPQRLKFTEERALAQFEWLHGRYNRMVVYSMSASRWAQVKHTLSSGGSL